MPSSHHEVPKRTVLQRWTEGKGKRRKSQQVLGVSNPPAPQVPHRISCDHWERWEGGGITLFLQYTWDHASKAIRSDVKNCQNEWIEIFSLFIIADSRTLLDEKDIGVITPYNAQSHRLKKALGEGIKVGSVEEFQGQVCCLASNAMLSNLTPS